jgi:glycosyltransferase involved in cell wall biosynthesis
MSISVVIPAFNRAHSIGRAIDSALAQAGGDNRIDVIVVDDGSSDDLAGALAGYGDRIRLIRHERNAGAAAARNTGVANAAGDYIAFLDSDDVWLPGKIAAQLEDIRRNQWRASCTAFDLRHANTREGVSPQRASGALDLSELVWGCFVSPGSTLMFERSLFDEIGPLDQNLGRLEDWDWLLRYAQRYPLGFLAAPLARIDASVHRNAGVILAAIEAMRAKHAPLLTPAQRRHFAAALDFEASAAHYRASQFASAFAALSASLLRAPFGNKALRAVVHNKLIESGLG